MTSAKVIRNDERSRYELIVEEAHESVVAGHADCVASPDSVRLTHTEIDPAHGGKGYGSMLAAAVVADIRAQGKTIVPECAFMAAYLKKEANRPPRS